ncbi:MAG: YajG family lipoprotein [Gammaproteobacteria bacterium]|jgi:hypothetical protein
MKKIFKFCVVITAVLGLSGCAMSMSNVSLNYKTPRVPKINRAKYNQSIKVSRIDDQRGENSRLIVHKINMNEETTSGGYLAEKPLNVVVQNALRNAFIKQGYIVKTHHATYELTGTLNDYSVKWITGMFSSRAISKLEMQFSLLNLKTHNVVWNNYVIGRGNYKSGESGGVVALLFNRALNSVIIQLTNSASFRQALLK